MKKERIKAFDLIRTLCTIGIVLFHYCFNYIEFGISGTHIFFARFTNGNWGGMFVAMFFMLSGAVLWYNYRDDFRIGRFYLRRWLSIFPMFYLAWFFAYLDKVKELGGWYWAGSRRLFIWTILGVDGYFLKPGVNMNYYTLGEWFLGAIVMLYVAFPLLRLLFIKPVVRWIFTAVLLVPYLYNIYTDWFAISDGKNMITCLMDFWLGMLIMEYVPLLIKKSDKVRYGVLAVLALIALAIMFIPRENFREVLVSTVCGAIWMAVIMGTCEGLMDVKPVGIFCKYISKWSFGIFLVHHVLLYAVMENFKGGNINWLQSIGLFLLNFALICAVGALLTLWGSFFTGAVNRIFRFAEEKLHTKY